MDRGDSGSAIVRRPNASEQKVPAVGLLFGGFVGQKVPELAFFTPAGRVAGALQKLSGVYLAPACDATVPAFKFQEYELKHTPPETEEVLGDDTAQDQQGESGVVAVEDVPDIDWTENQYTWDRYRPVDLATRESQTKKMHSHPSSTFRTS
jgi:hypothetical protein